MQVIELTEGANLKLDQPMRLAQAGSISGRVVDLSGHPAAKASVSVSKSALQFSVRLTIDDNGNFQAASLPPGEYSLYISLHDQTISIQGVEVQPGVETKLPDPVQLKPFNQAEPATD
ncbi:MAG TPA: carboxypeptidase-like regulatory domain-containing protein [Opitutales bacterium]|nr:carboxypeptidase-like regulatory domain-containing protein [Opitutales bacterium]